MEDLEILGASSPMEAPPVTQEEMSPVEEEEDTEAVCGAACGQCEDGTCQDIKGHP